MRFVTIAVALSITLSAAEINATPPAATYDFKGVPLEISLDDFRKRPHPDGTPARVVCTGDKTTKPHMMFPVEIHDDTEKLLGITKCMWVGTEQGIYKDAPRILALPADGYGVSPYTFSFVRDPVDGVTKLFSFSGRSRAIAMLPVLDALSKKFGDASVVKGTVQNGIGNKFDQTTATWDNGAGTLIVQDRNGEIDDMIITMDSIRLKRHVDDAKNVAAKAKPNPI